MKNFLEKVHHTCMCVPSGGTLVQYMTYISNMHLNAYNIYEASHTCTCTYTYIFIYTYRYIPGYNLNYLSILFPRSLL